MSSLSATEPGATISNIEYLFTSNQDVFYVGGTQFVCNIVAILHISFVSKSLKCGFIALVRRVLCSLCPTLEIDYLYPFIKIAFYVLRRNHKLVSLCKHRFDCKLRRVDVGRLFTSH